MVEKIAAKEIFWVKVHPDTK